MSRSHILLTATFVWAACAGSTRAQTCLYSEPPSDFCPSAFELEGTVGQHVVMMDVHDATGTREICNGTFVGYTVWFRVIPDVSGPMTVSTCHPATTYDTVIEVYEGGESNCDTLGIIKDCNDDTALPECDNGCSFWSSSVTFDATAGQLYRIVVGSFDENSAECALCLGLIVTIGDVCGDPPRNLGCQIATELPGQIGIYEAVVDVDDAFVLDDEPEPACGLNLGHTVWFKTTPDIDGVIKFTTCHPNTTYDTVLQAWTGSCTGFLVDAGCRDDLTHPDCDNGCSWYGSTLYVDAAAGGDYFFQVGSYNQNIAGCELCLGVTLSITCVRPDLDFDGDVDLSDLALLLSVYGRCEGEPGYSFDADFDEDGCVDLSDLAELLSLYGLIC